MRQNTLNDGWTAVTRDKTLTAQFEHTVGITKDRIRKFYSDQKLKLTC